MIDPRVWEDIDTCRDPWGGALGTPDVSDLPEPLRTDLWDKVKDFAGQPMSNWLQTQIRKTMKAADDRLRYWLRRDPGDPKTWLVSFHVGDSFARPRGKTKRWRQFPEGNAPRLFAPAWEQRAIQRIEPGAVAGRSGTVPVQVLVAADGHVAETFVDEGPAELREAAIEIARQWTFKPYAQAGHAFEVQTVLKLEFPAATGCA